MGAGVTVTKISSCIVQLPSMAVTEYKVDVVGLATGFAIVELVRLVEGVQANWVALVFNNNSTPFPSQMGAGSVAGVSVRLLFNPTTTPAIANSQPLASLTATS
jgi:hypothetical protein